MNHELLALVSIPLISAAIGWLTNYIAVKMLFRPRHAWNLLGLRIQGLVPRRQEDLAEKIGETVQNRLLTHDDIRDALQRPEIHAEMERLIDREVEAFFDERLGRNRVVAALLRSDIARNLRGVLADQLKEAMPDVIDDLMDRVSAGVDLKAIVKRKVLEFEVHSLERLVHDIAAKELKLIEILGGVLGLLVGLVQVGILLLARHLGAA